MGASESHHAGAQDVGVAVEQSADSCEHAVAVRGNGDYISEVVLPL